MEGGVGAVAEAAGPLGDRWQRWLLGRRFGGDPEELRRTLAHLGPIRDRVLDHAAAKPGEVWLDVGTGDGLVAFAALERVGPDGVVILSDVSGDLLDHDRALAGELGVADRCRFVEAAADDLAAIGDASVDVVTTRSVLIYVAAKGRALAEFARVLRPRGRISLFEPINRFGYHEAADRFWGYDVGPEGEAAAKVRAVFQARQPIDGDPMMDFDERDLFRLAGEAGFGERHLRLELDAEAWPGQRWETFAATAFNPLIPTLAEAMAEALTPAERARFTARLRPLVERGEGVWPRAVAYLWGTKG